MPRLFSNAVRLAAAMAVCATAALSDEICPDDKGAPQFDPANHDQCAAWLPEVLAPSNPDGTPKPLNEYETVVGKFFNNYCHRDPELGFAVDKDVRNTGPFFAWRDQNNEWQTKYHGFHAPVVIWYSPAMLEWLETNRPADPAMAPETVAPIPDGVLIVKEMMTAPASRCAGRPLENLAPQSGIAYMVRDTKAAHDGWFWGYFGFFEGETDPNVDWPPRPGNSVPYAGFGQYCLNCHASAENNSTFSSLSNIEGQPGEPITYLSMDWMLDEIQTGGQPPHVPEAPGGMEPIPHSTPLTEVPEAFKKIFVLPLNETLAGVSAISMPSQTYDNVWALPGEILPLASTYLTSDQCAGCHDAGSTGLAFDMTTPNPDGDNLINLSPYATWRSSPMGLAGRDPIFFGQLASEEELHPDYLDLIWNTCFGCHGIMGQRQFQLDQNEAGTACTESVFTPDMVTAIPYDNGNTDPSMGPHYDLASAKYGALARDGISCVACHRTVLTPEDTAKYEDEPQNACILERQKELNEQIGGLTGFGKTFTGSFLVTDTDTLFGPFEKPKTKPMDHALGIIPEHSEAIASSEQCGTCHTVHLPVLWPEEEKGKVNVIADTFEQTTYPEWLFSKFRTGTAAFLPEGEMLPHGAGDDAISCAGCHLESTAEDGTQFTSRIASIQQKSTMPEADYTLSADEIDVPVRTGFARHTLVGLNLFLVKMAQQFPDVLGIPLEDPMLVANGMAGLQRTENEMVKNADTNTAAIHVTGTRLTSDTLEVTVEVENKAGHKFPSGVSFRRAFIEFEVLDASGTVLWHSGATDSMGVLTGPDGNALKGELWYDDMCNKIVTQTDFQPHYQVIDSQEQVQIYQEVKLDPGDPAVAKNPQCGEGAPVDPSANLTTSFLSICHSPKDNRLLPAGLLDFDARVEVAKAMGLEGDAETLAAETGAFGVGDDPDYVTGGGDSLVYRVALADLQTPPATVRATLHYQATPPFFLQDRFCTGTGVNRDRLYYLTSLLNTTGTPIEDWSFEMVTTGAVSVP